MPLHRVTLPMYAAAIRFDHNRSQFDRDRFSLYDLTFRFDRDTVRFDHDREGMYRLTVRFDRDPLQLHRLTLLLHNETGVDVAEKLSGGWTPKLPVTLAQPLPQRTINLYEIAPKNRGFNNSETLGRMC